MSMSKRTPTATAIIRDAIDADLPAIIDIYNAAIATRISMAGLSKAKLRSYLLEHSTVSDKAWNAAYGAPAREADENREAYIRRVLA